MISRRLSLTRDPAPPERPRGAWTQGARISVLLAEDHPINVRVVELILRPFGFQLTVASNGIEAVEAFERAPFDLILMDMQMPELDGLSAVARIRALEAAQQRPRTPIAILSANVLGPHREQVAAADVDGYIPKPVSARSLLDGVERALAGPPRRQLMG